MKLVFCGGHIYYERFIRKLWAKDKDVSNYRYVDTHRDLHGGSRDDEAIKLASFAIHPEKEELWAIAQTRGITPRPLRDRPRIGHGVRLADRPMMEGGLSYVEHNGRPPEPLILRDESIPQPTLTSTDGPMLTVDGSSLQPTFAVPLRGQHVDSYIIDEPGFEDGGTINGAFREMYGEQIRGLVPSGIQPITYTGTPPQTLPQRAEINEETINAAIGNMYSQIGIEYGQEREEIQRTENPTTNSEQAQQMAQDIQRIRSQEREEDRAARWWDRGDEVMIRESHGYSSGFDLGLPYGSFVRLNDE